MPKHLHRIISDFHEVPKGLVKVAAAYILYLMLETRGHQARQGARLAGLHESSFSRFLNRPDSLRIGKHCLNRAAQRRLKRLGKQHGSKRPLLLIDSTLVGRRGKKVENASFHRMGRKSVRGHKFINFVLLVGNEVIPLSTVAHYSRSYCEFKGFDYRTENELVIDWLNWLHYSGLFSKDHIKHLHVVCDAGYDAKQVQKAINRIGCHFTMAIKCNRLINGIAADEYFRRNRFIPWKSLRLFVEKDGKRMRKEYRTRFAPKVKLKGFGLVSAAYSEAKKRDGGKTRKYLVSSDTKLSAREIIDNYRRRWRVETWHREMKQAHAFGDCRSPSFAAFEAHVNLCLTAYNLQRCEEAGIPKPGTTFADYVGVKKIQEASAVLTRFGGRASLKRQAAAAAREIFGREAA